jgi:hypothetical protein
MADDPSQPCSLPNLGVRGVVSVCATAAYGFLVPALFLYLLARNSVGVRTDLALHQTGRGVSTPSNNPYHYMRLRLSTLYATMTARRWVTAAVCGTARGGQQPAFAQLYRGRYAPACGRCGPAPSADSSLSCLD